MKHFSKPLITILSVICLTVCLAVCAFAADSNISFLADADNADTVINVQKARDGKDYLFLPSGADLTELVLTFSGDAKEANGTAITSGVAFDLTAIATAKDGVYTLTFSDGTSLNIMKSDNIRTIFDYLIPCKLIYDFIEIAQSS